MTRRHSLFTRCLAVLLALVLIASNGAGLTLGARAAENTGTLFELIELCDTFGDKGMTEALKYEQAFTAVHGMNITDISYETAPETVPAGTLLRNGTVTTTAIGTWIPNRATAGETTSYFAEDSENEGNYVASGLPVGVLANVTYMQTIGSEAHWNTVAELGNKIIEVALGVRATSEQLKTITGGNNLNNLKLLRAGMITGLKDEIAYMTLDSIMDTTSMTEQEILVAEQQFLPQVQAEMTAVLEKLEKRIIPAGQPNGGYLQAYVMLNNCNDPEQGMGYYYQNEDKIKEELNALKSDMESILKPTGEYAEYMNAALNYLLESYGKTRDSLDNVASEVEAAIINLNKIEFDVGAYIDMKHEDATALCNALDKVDPMAIFGVILMMEKTFEVEDDTYAQIKFTGVDYTTDPVIKGEKLTQAQIDKFVEDIEAKNPHCDVEITVKVGDEAVDLAVLAETALYANVEFTVTATPAQYTYELIDAEGNATTKSILGNAKTIELPIPENFSWKYKIVKDGVEGEEVSDATITLVDGDMDLISQNKYTVKVTAVIDEIQEKLIALFDAVNKKIGRDDAFVLTGDKLTANINMSEIQTFGEEIIKREEKVDLNDKLFVDGVAQTVSAQALVDALLAEGFDDAKLEELATAGKGALLSDATLTIYGRELGFTLNLTEVPAEMATASNALASLGDMVNFDTKNGQVNVFVKLPEKAYELYLTKALAESEVTKNNAEINRKVAMEYVVDTMTEIAKAGAKTAAFENSLAAIGIQKDLPEKFFDPALQVFAGGDFDAATYTENGISVVIDGTKDTISPLLREMGFGSVASFMADETVAVTVNVTLTNETPKFDAVVVAPKAEGMMNKLDYTTKLSTVKGPAAVVLLDNVGDLVFEGTAILDLNGKTVNGNITSNGTLYIVDSLLGNTSCGTVTGTVTGNAVIMGGKFGSDVSGMLKTGYIQKADGTVQNAMYTLNTSGITLHPDFFTKENLKNYEDIVKATAVDIAADLILNGYRYSSVNYDGQNLFAAEYTDLLGILKDKDVEGLIGQTVGNVGAAGITQLTNDIIADLLDFDAVAAAVEGDGIIATYPISASHWDVDVNYNGEYITADLKAANTGFSKNVPLNVEKLPATVKEYAAKALRELDAITNEASLIVALEQPTYANKTLTVAGGATAKADVDLHNSTHYDYYIKAIAVAVSKGDIEAAKALYAEGNDAVKAKFDAANVKAVLEELTTVTYQQIAELAAQVNNETVDSYLEKYESQLTAAVEKVNAGATKILNRFEGHALLNKTIGSLEIEDGIYGWKGALQNKTVDATRLEHTVKLTVTKVDVDAKINIFGEVKDRGYIFLDLNPLTGKTLAELEKTLVIDEFGAGAKLSIKNAEDASYTGIAKTGMKVAITSGNKTLNYTLIVLGDTNKDGINLPGDNSFTRNMVLKLFEGDVVTVEDAIAAGYEEVVVLAADANMDGDLLPGDNSRIRNKTLHIYDSENPEEAWNNWIADHYIEGTQN